MMENYEQEDYSRKMKGIIMMDASRVHEVKIESEQSDFISASELLDKSEHKQNFNFGAEIVKARQQQQHVQHECKEEASKTNIAKTHPTTAVLEVTEQPEIPINVAELPPITADDEDDEEPSDEVDDSVSCQSNEEDDEDDDDEEEEEDTGNASSQLEAHSGLADMDGDSDESTSDSDFSDLSGLSDMSGREWKPVSARPINWVQKQIHSGANPRELLSQMLPTSAHQIAPGLNDVTLWRILASLISEPPRRQKLRHINTFEDVIQLIERSKNIIVLTGAGVSVSCGIPDFRSSDGIYSRLAKDYPDLPDPQAMFDIGYFSRDPRPFFKFAREIYPGQFKPSPCHRFIKLLEEKQKLLRNYTQNIDTLEQVAGIRNVIECHGSFSSASCTKCRYKCDADAIRADIFAQSIPVCPRCQPNVQQSVDASQPVSEMELKQLVENGIMKPDIVFFGEGLPQEFHTVMASDKDKCDLLIVMGSSLKVRPVALIPSSIPADVPQILINREQLHHLEFDVELLGDSDVIINQLCHCLGGDWQQICFNENVLKEAKDLLPLDELPNAEGEIDGDGEEDAPNALDTDTQSIKSNASTDIALRSAGAYSDSGFESSTSSGVAAKLSGIGIGSNHHHQHYNHHNHHNQHNETQKAIEQLKSEMLQPLTKTKTVDLLPPDLLDEPMEEAVDFGHPDFHAFSSRLNERSVTTPSSTENYRHLSIDSTKDSGMCCDSSNSALPSTSSSNSGALLPPVTSFSGSGGTHEPTSEKTNNTNNALASTSPTDDENVCSSIEINTNTAGTTLPTTGETHELKRCRQQKRQSAAERLIDGTYYWHESSSSYVFPGAQVSWCMDSEDDVENDDGGIVDLDDEDDEFNDDTDGNIDNASPLSPLLPPSVEAEMVKEITTTTNVFSSATITAATAYANATHYNNMGSGKSSSCSSSIVSVNLKRHSTETIETEEDDADDVDDETAVTLIANNNNSNRCGNDGSNSRSSSSSHNNNANATNIHLSNKEITPSLQCSPPPLKRRRDSCDSPNTSKNNASTTTAATSNNAISPATETAVHLTSGGPTTAAAVLAVAYNKNNTINTSPILSPSALSHNNGNSSNDNNKICNNSSSSGSLENSSPPAEALLQQF